MLAPGEEILLEAEAAVNVARPLDHREGRAYLTTRRIIWIRRTMTLLGPFLFVLWLLPREVTVELSSMDQVRIVRQWTRAWLRIKAGGKVYHFRVGKGPYPLLRDNRKTVEEWAHAIEVARGDPAAPAVKTPLLGLTAALGLLVGSFATGVFSLPFIPGSVPEVLIIIIVTLSLVGFGAGSLMLRDPWLPSD